MMDLHKVETLKNPFFKEPEPRPVRACVVCGKFRTNGLNMQDGLICSNRCIKRYFYKNKVRQAQMIKRSKKYLGLGCIWPRKAS